MSILSVTGILGMFVTEAKLTDTRFLQEKYLVALAASGTGAGRCPFEDCCGIRVCWQMTAKRNHPILFHPGNQAILTSLICAENHFSILTEPKGYIRIKASHDLWNSQSYVGGIRQQHNSLSLWEMKGSAPSGHMPIGTT